MTAMDWINTNESLPPPYHKVMIVDGGQVKFGFIAPKKDSMYLEMYEVYEGNVAKWMEIPETEKDTSNGK
jgi:sRNA-binding carbon storage regulator CsrA